MPDCPVCDGEGQVDMRDSDAYISEHWTDREIAVAKARGMIHPLGIIECEECEGRGVLSVEKLRDLEAYATASIDQALAKLKELGLAD
jgi:DnaJ-class molecular chaperone